MRTTNTNKNKPANKVTTLAHQAIDFLSQINVVFDNEKKNIYKCNKQRQVERPLKGDEGETAAHRSRIVRSCVHNITYISEFWTETITDRGLSACRLAVYDGVCVCERERTITGIVSKSF